MGLFDGTRETYRNTKQGTGGDYDSMWVKFGLMPRLWATLVVVVPALAVAAGFGVALGEYYDPHLLGDEEVTQWASAFAAFAATGLIEWMVLSIRIGRIAVDGRIPDKYQEFAQVTNPITPWYDETPPPPRRKWPKPGYYDT